MFWLVWTGLILGLTGLAVSSARQKNIEYQQQKLDEKLEDILEQEAGAAEDIYGPPAPADVPDELKDIPAATEKPPSITVVETPSGPVTVETPGGLLGTIQEEQLEINEAQAEINRLALEKVQRETKFDLEQMQRQMDERLALGRARRGVSGLTAKGSPLLVRQYVADQYAKMMQFRQEMGGIQERELTERGEIIEGQADILALQGNIRVIEGRLKQAGIEFERAEFGVAQEIRKIEQRYHNIASLLDLGSQIMTFGYGMYKTRIPGYQTPFEAPASYRYGGL